MKGALSVMDCVFGALCVIGMLSLLWKWCDYPNMRNRAESAEAALYSFTNQPAAKCAMQIHILQQEVDMLRLRVEELEEGRKDED